MNKRIFYLATLLFFLSSCGARPYVAKQEVVYSAIVGSPYIACLLVERENCVSEVRQQMKLCGKEALKVMPHLIKNKHSVGVYWGNKIGACASCIDRFPDNKGYCFKKYFH